MMRRFCLRGAVMTLIAFPLLAQAQYKAERVGGIVTLTDTAHQTVVSIAPDVGDLTFSMKVKGQDVLHFPYTSPDRFKQQNGLAGIPLLAPWANRLDQQAFYANGKKYIFNMTLGNVNGAIPSHGFLIRTDAWQVVELKADRHAAWLTSRLDFYKHADWMAQFPFAHTLELTQRLSDGVLEVHLKIDNLSVDPMPVAIGFHPYIQLTDSPREDWKIGVGAKTHYLLDPRKVPTGETEPTSARLKDPSAAPLKDYNLDDVFGDLVRDDKGRAHFSVSGKHQKVTLEFGPKFESAVIYSPNPADAPPRRSNMTPRPANAPPRVPEGTNFVCFEPYASITDALNLEQAGKFKGVQYIEPGGSWAASFWVVPSGF